MQPLDPGNRGAPLVLLLVRDAVSHDARVMREAEVLDDLGYDVLVAGVVSAEEPRVKQRLGSALVIRLDPVSALRSLTGLPRSPHSPRRAPRSSGANDSVPPRPVCAWGRLAVTAAYYAQGVKLVLQTSPSLVHANDYNTMWIAAAAKLLRGSRVVYDSHELWPDRNGRPEWRPWLIACEALFVRLADALVTTSPGYAEAIAARYRVAAPLVVRNIPVQHADLPPPPPRAGEPPLTVYVGSLMPGRGLEDAIEALALAPEVRMRLIGPGRDWYLRSLHSHADRLGVTDRLELVPAVAPDQVVETIAGADLGLMLIEPVCRSYELTLPNKLFEYAAAGVPMLATDLPVIGPLVRSEHLGEVVAPGDVTQIARVLRELDRLGEGRAAARREPLLAFARATPWAQERLKLRQVYAPAGEGRREVAEGGGGRRVADVYAGYADSPAAARRWDAANPGNAAIRSELVQAVWSLAGAELAAARDVLDVGCGLGWWLAELAADGRVLAGLHGLDLLDQRVQAARERLGQRAQIVRGDARELPYDDASVDVVSVFTVLSSLAGPGDVKHVLRQVARVLRPAGVLLVWEPRVPNPLNRHTRLVSLGLIRSGLGEASYQVRTTTVVPVLARRLGSRTPSVYRRLSHVGVLRTHRLIAVHATPRPS